MASTPTRSRHRPLHRLLLLLGAALLGACSEPPPPLRYLTQDATVLAFGDSLTYGSGAAAQNSYPAVLETLIGRRVVNAGVPGELSAAGLQRLPELLDEFEPQLLLLCHGGNDMLRRQGAAQAKQYLRDMVLLARERGIEVVLIGVPEPALFLLESAPFYGELAKELAIPIEDEALPRIESDRTLKSDQIHPNAAGYRQLAQALAELLKQAGAI